MRFLVVYGTSEGQTRKIAGFMADRLRANGHSVTLVDVAAKAPAVDPARFDAAIVCGQVHTGRYPHRLVNFAKRNAESLSAMPSVFVSVSMVASRDDVRSRARVSGYVQRFVRSTGWTPRMVHQAAGARYYSHHGALAARLLAWIDRASGFRGDALHDEEWTDWQALARFTDLTVTTARAAAAAWPGQISARAG